jgi:hypothetical protein
LAVFTSQTDLANPTAVAQGKDSSPSSIDLSDLKGMYKQLVVPGIFLFGPLVTNAGQELFSMKKIY